MLYCIWIHEYAAALGWGFVASVSDVVDGFLARRLHAQSRAGAYLDPIADKLLLSGSYLTLALTGAVPWWVTAVVFGRDAVMLLALAILFLFTKIRDFPPSVWGKVSTAIQILTGLVILLSKADWLGTIGGRIERPFLFLTVIATTWSGVHYFWAGVGRLRASAQNTVGDTAH